MLKHVQLRIMQCLQKLQVASMKKLNCECFVCWHTNAPQHEKMASVLQFKFRMAKEHNSLSAVGLFTSFLPSCLMAFKVRFSQFWKLPFIFKGGERICLNVTYIWYCYHLWGLPDLVIFSVHFKYGKSILSVDFNSWRMSAVTFGLKFHTSNNQITQAGNIYMFVYSFTVTHKGCSYM